VRSDGRPRPARSDGRHPGRALGRGLVGAVFAIALTSLSTTGVALADCGDDGAAPAASGAASSTTAAATTAAASANCGAGATGRAAHSDDAPSPAPPAAGSSAPSTTTATGPSTGTSSPTTQPAPKSQPKRDPVKWDASQPYRGLGFREVEAETDKAKYDIVELPVVKA